MHHLLWRKRPLQDHFVNLRLHERFTVMDSLQTKRILKVTLAFKKEKWQLIQNIFQVFNYWWMNWGVINLMATHSLVEYSECCVFCGIIEILTISVMTPLTLTWYQPWLYWMNMKTIYQATNSWYQLTYPQNQFCGKVFNKINVISNSTVKVKRSTFIQSSNWIREFMSRADDSCSDWCHRGSDV